MKFEERIKNMKKDICFKKFWKLYFKRERYFKLGCEIVEYLLKRLSRRLKLGLEVM